MLYMSFIQWLYKTVAVWSLFICQILTFLVLLMRSNIVLVTVCWFACRLTKCLTNSSISSTLALLASMLRIPRLLQRSLSMVVLRWDFISFRVEKHLSHDALLTGMTTVILKSLNKEDLVRQLPCPHCFHVCCPQEHVYPSGFDRVTACTLTACHWDAEVPWAGVHLLLNLYPLLVHIWARHEKIQPLKNGKKVINLWHRFHSVCKDKI